MCCTCKTSIKQELTVLFSKSWEIKKTNKQQLDLCDYTESFIESVPIVFYTFQWKATRSFLNIQQMILSWKEQLVKKRTVWLLNEYSCTLYELKVPLKNWDFLLNNVSFIFMSLFSIFCILITKRGKRTSKGL